MNMVNPIHNFLIVTSKLSVVHLGETVNHHFVVYDSLTRIKNNPHHSFKK